MSTYNLRLGMTLAAAFISTAAWAQHDAHQTASSQAASAELTQCLRVQPVIENIIAAAMSRAEAARLSNSPAEMRAVVEHLEAALRDIRAQSAPCSTAAASTDPHAGHTMPGMQPPSSSPAQTPMGAADPHAGHTMPSTPSSASATTPARAPAAGGDPRAGHVMSTATGASKGRARSQSTPRAPSKAASPDEHSGHTIAGAAPAAPSPKPAGTQPAPAAVDSHAGHREQPVDKRMDPVNGLMVDPATAPRTTYQGQTYYFSSEQSRKEFLENPAKFARKPKG
jgi:YHS domain-containing protein